MAKRIQADDVKADVMWQAVSTGAGVLSAVLAKRLLRLVYRSVRKDTDPESPFDLADKRFSWTDALLWSVAAGIGLGIAKMVSARLAAIGWEAATGEAPPVAHES